MKKTLIIVILPVFIFFASAFNFAKAQVPTVPKPTCMEVPGGPPCPKDWKTNILPEQPSTPLSNLKKNANQIFSDLLNAKDKLIIVGKIITDKILGQIVNTFNDIFGKYIHPRQ